MAQRPNTSDDYSRASQYRILAHVRKVDELSSIDSDEDNMCDALRNINCDSEDDRSGDEHSYLNSQVNELRSRFAYFSIMTYDDFRILLH